MYCIGCLNLSPRIKKATKVPISVIPASSIVETQRSDPPSAKLRIKKYKTPQYPAIPQNKL
jgi:hypothetical protein